MFRLLVVTSILLLAAPPTGAAGSVEYGNLKNDPWSIGTNRFLNQDHLTMGTCEANSIGAIICFEFFWRDGKLELYAIMPFPPGQEGKFAEWKVPDFQIGPDYDFSLNRLLASDRAIGYPGFPQINRGNMIAWRIQISSADDMRNHKRGMNYNLSHGGSAVVTVNVDDGSTIDTEFLLEGLAPLLEKMLQEAEAAAPYYQGKK